MENEQKNNNMLWQIAKRRAGFKASLLVYVLVNLLLVIIWYLTTGRGSYFWPVWSVLGWGIGIIAQYIGAYHYTQIFSAEKEYEKLKQTIK